MKKITAVLMIMAIMMTSMAMPEAFVSEFADEAITATAATDAWGREYLTYGDLKYQVQSDNTICIIGFDISKDTVEIPDEIDGMPVTKIGAYAFSDAKLITEVVIPDTVTAIAVEAFSYCTRLEKVNIPYGVTTIGNYAFENCESLTEITIPETVISIGEYAFTYTALTEVVVPDSVQTLKYRAFFCCGDLVSAKLPTTITTLGKDIFGFCKKLETVNIPTNITAIPERLFFRCTNLNNVTIPESVTTIDKMSFYYCESLESINIPSAVKTIKESAFNGCYALETVDMTEGVTTMGKYVFQDCTSLTEITLPKSLTSAGNFCFSRCDSLDIKVYEGSYGYDYVNGKYNSRDHIIICVEGSELLKYQFAEGDSEDTYSARYLLVVDEETALNAETANIYLSIDEDTTTQVVEIKKAYRSVYAAGKLVSAGEGKVFVTCAFRNVPKDFDVMTAHVMLDTQRYERTSYYSDELV